MYLITVFDFEGTFLKSYTAQWLSWLERRPVTAEVVGSSPIWVVSAKSAETFYLWGLSSAGRASALQAEGHRFEPYRPHNFKGGFPSGQRGQTVNLLATLSVVRIHHRPLPIIGMPMWLNWQSS